MKKYSIIKNLAQPRAAMFMAFAVAFLPLLSSCDDEPEVGSRLYPTEEETYGPKVYINELGTNGNSATVNVVKTPTDYLVTDSDTISFYVHLNQPVSSDVTVSVAQDDAAAEAYGKSYKALQGGLNILNKSVTIKAGSEVSETPVQALVSADADIKNLDSQVAAIKLTSASNGAEVGSTLNTFYVLFNKKETNLKSTNKKDLEGLQQVDYGDYTVYIDGSEITELSNGNTRDYLYLGYSGQYDVIMAFDTPQPIKALTYYWGYSYWYCPNLIEIQTSDDGENWTSQTGGKQKAEVPETQAIPAPWIFYSPIKATYIKLTVYECAYARYGDYYNTPILSEVKLYK